MDNSKFSLKKLMASLTLILAALIWGCAFVAQSVGMDYVGPFTFNAIRMVMAGIVLTPVAILADKHYAHGDVAPLLSRANLKVLIPGGALCALALFGGTTFQQFGLIYTTPGKSGFITALYMVFVPIVSIFFGKRAPKTVWFAVLFAAAGMYFLCVDDFSINIGDMLTLICAFFFTAHILFIDRFSPKLNPIALSCVQFWIAGIVSLVLMFIFESPDITLIMQCAIPLLYAGIMSGGVAYTLQIVGQRSADPAVASVLLSLESVFAALAGWLLLPDGALSASELAGCALVFIAVLLAQYQPKQKR